MKKKRKLKGGIFEMKKLMTALLFSPARYVSDHSSPAAVPTFPESKKRMRGENVERFFDDVKREKIEPIPTKGAEPRPDFWLKNFTLSFSPSLSHLIYTHRE